MSSISSVDSSARSVQSNWQTTANQRKQDLANLSQSLQSGDLAGAKTAFADLQKVDPKRFGANNNAGSGSSSSSNPLQNDIKALSQALSNNDLSGAQKAFAQLQTDFKAQASGAGGSGSPVHRHHHHHDSDGDSNGSTATTTSTSSVATPTASPSSGNTSGSIVSVLA